MHKPLEITFRDIDRSDSAVSVIEKKCENLDRFYPQINSAHVTISAPDHRFRKSKTYHVTIEVDVPRKKHLIVDYEPEERSAEKSLPLVINHAFRIMEQRLQDHARQQRSLIRHRTEEESIEDIPAPLIDGVLPVDLTEGMCRWPIGDPREEDFMFCGRNIRAGSPYCAQHTAMAYQTPRKELLS
jgi:ribosome-associated translation inhibitor RaiA